ncbi:MAG: hypothetical protein K2N09_01805 [Muribaculaceae bacterium]|nr:hypothetical protein [Muribaculaceae bacterium]
MRNSTVAVLGLAFVMAMPVTARQTSPLKLMKDIKARVQTMYGQSEMPETPAGKRLTHKMNVSELAGKLKWSKAKTFGWDGEEWIPEENIQYSYDTSGNIILETSEDADGIFTRVETGYDANGMRVSELSKISADGVNFENDKKVEIGYDPILTNVITRHYEWLWDGEWIQNGNNYERRITRDGAGNVTETVIAVLYDGIFDPTQRLKVTYGADGKATEIAEEILDYDGKEFFWVAGDKITDIVWDTTDGQIVDMDNIFAGSNRIKSGQMEDSDGLIFDLKVDYAAGGAYTMSMTTNLNGMSMITTSEVTPLENDGYIVVTKAMFLGQVLLSMTQEARTDEWGLLILEQLSQEGMEGNYVEGTKGIVEYDAEGKPVTYTVISFNEDSESGESETEYVLRAEFSDYVDVTAGVSCMEPEAVSPRYYNLQGMPVTAPQKGTIVICNGKKTVY